MDNLLLISQIVLFGLSTILLVMGIFTYRVTKNKKVLISCGVFVLFILQALLSFLAEFVEALDIFQEARVFLLFDVGVLLVLYLATVKS